MDASIIWLLPAFILPCAAAWRLGKFNLDDTQSHSFKGMPVPAVGIFVASFPLIYWNVNEQWVKELLLNKWFLYSIVVGFSWLMVSTVPLMALKFKNFGIKQNLPAYLLIIIAIVSFLILKWLAVPLIIIVYVVLSLIFKTKSA